MIVNKPEVLEKTFVVCLAPFGAHTDLSETVYDLCAVTQYSMTLYGMTMFSVHAALPTLFLSGLKPDLCVDIQHHGLRMLDVLEKPFVSSTVCFGKLHALLSEY